MKHVITQGEYLATADKGATISTLLGSCVSCCLWDPLCQAGGMNHILLAARASSSEYAPNLSAMAAMELLINELLKLGARRERLLAKAFGGASMISGLSSIGSENSNFLLSYLKNEGIECVSQSLGGTMARQIIFTPSTGSVRMKMRKSAEPERKTAPLPESSTLELF